MLHLLKDKHSPKVRLQKNINQQHLRCQLHNVYFKECTGSHLQHKTRRGGGGGGTFIYDSW